MFFIKNIHAVFFLFAICSLHCGVSHAAPSDYGLNIPNDGSPLYWTPTRLASAQARYLTNPSQYPLPSPAGGTVETVLNQAFIKMMRGTCTPANGGSTTEIDTCGDAVNWILNTSPFVCTGNCANLDDDARWYGEITLLGYSWLRDQMTPAQRQNVLAGMARAVGGTFSKGWGEPADTGNNYNWGYFRNGIYMGLILAKEAQNGNFTALTTNCSWPGESGGHSVNFCNLNASQLSDAILTEALNVRWPLMRSYLSNQAAGGALPEGANYGHYLLSYYTFPLILMGDYGRNFVEETPYWKEAAWNLIYATTNRPVHPVQTGVGISGFSTPWYTVPTYGNTQSVHGTPPAGQFEEGGFMTWMATRYEGTTLGERIRHWLTKVNPQRTPYVKVMDGELGQAGTDFSSLPLDYCSSGYQFCHLRDSWNAGTNDKPTGFFIEAGAVNNPGGNHPDCSAGSWQAWRGDRWVSKEAANAYDRTNTNLSGSGPLNAGSFMSHNNMTVNDLQPNGFCPVPQTPAPNVTRRQHTHDFFFISSDLRQHMGLGSGVTGMVRDYLYIRSLNTLCTFDRVQTTSNISKNTFLHFPRAPTQNGNVFSATNNTEVLRATVLSGNVAGQTATYTVRDEGAFGTGRGVDNDPQYRLEIRTSGTTMSYIPVCSQAYSTGDSLVDVALQEDVDSIDLTLTRAGSSPIVASFDKAATSTGGSFRIGSGATTALSNSIESLVANENGVSWNGGVTPPPPPPTGSACDINANGSTNVTDVQLCANQAIGVTTCTTGDINQDSSCNVIDVQRVVNAALGGACVSQ